MKQTYCDICKTSAPSVKYIPVTYKSPTEPVTGDIFWEDVCPQCAERLTAALHAEVKKLREEAP